ncbi:MAG: hypothetical protein E7057_07125 [Lentisphaerae bacterium]|nr:hypothetical protein [Lentisphaerota bacterium]
MIRKFLILLFLVPLMMANHAMADGIEDMQGLELKNIKIPFYKDQKLQLLIFADSGQRQERYMVGSGTFLDMLLEDADVDKIPDGWRAKLYPLGSQLDKVLDFWKKRYKISEAVIFTDASSIDQTEERVFGEKPVYFRAPAFDLNGVGFSVEFRRQIIEINSDVQIIARSSDMDPRKIFAGAPVPKEQKIIKAFSQKMRIDQRSNKIMLIGDVKVIDGRNTLTCNRLTIFLDKDKNQKATRQTGGDEKAVLDGISRVLADGDVRLVQLPEDPAKFATEFQESRSDHLEYDVKRQIIILTGDTVHPTLSRGSDTKLSGRRIELLRHEDKMFVMQDCRITSLVRDARGVPQYERRINSDRANFDGKTNVANFHSNVIAMDQTTTMTCSSLRVHLKQDPQTSSQKIDLLFASGNVNIVSRSLKDVPDSPGKKSVSLSTISSKQAELNYVDNKLIFYNNVKVRDDSATLDCIRLDIFLADKTDDGKKEKAGNSGAPMAAGMEGKDKTVTQIVAKSRVRMISKGDTLNTDMLTLFFRDLPPGMKPSPGMIQSGGVQLIKILCDGNVRAVSANKEDDKQPPRVLRAAHAMSDLLKDYSEFHGDVSMVDGNTQINSRDMYIFTGASPINEIVVEEKAEPEKKVDNFDADSLDADPFAMDMGENSVPTRIAISDTRDLKRVVCQRQVVLIRKDKNGKKQRAGGDRAVYTVNTREVVLTAEPPNRPWMRSDGRKQFCDIIRSDMATEDLRGIGNVVVMPDDK